MILEITILKKVKEDSSGKNSREKSSSELKQS